MKRCQHSQLGNRRADLFVDEDALSKLCSAMNAPMTDCRDPRCESDTFASRLGHRLPGHSNGFAMSADGDGAFQFDSRRSLHSQFRVAQRGDLPSPRQVRRDLQPLGMLVAYSRKSGIRRSRSNMPPLA